MSFVISRRVRAPIAFVLCCGIVLPATAFTTEPLTLEEASWRLAEQANPTRRAVRAEVEQHFVDVLALQLRAETETQTLKVIQDASRLMQKRMQAGQDNRLDLTGVH